MLIWDTCRSGDLIIYRRTHYMIDGSCVFDLQRIVGVFLSLNVNSIGVQVVEIFRSNTICYFDALTFTPLERITC